jgi:hypothetical protein
MKNVAVAAVVFPVPERLVERLLSENRNVFVKYVARTTNLRITPKNKLILYASHGSAELVGEGIIQTIELLTPSEVLDKYGSKVFLDRDELMAYATQEPGRTLSKRMLVLALDKIKTYKPHIKWKKPMTMAGQYLTEEEYRKLRER